MFLRYYVLLYLITVITSGMIIYIEESHTPGNYYIRKLDDDTALTVNSFANGADVMFGAGVTTWQFDPSFIDFLEDGAFIVPSSHPSDGSQYCVKINTELELEIGIDSDCSGKNYSFKHYIDSEGYPMYKYGQANYSEVSSGDAPYLYEENGDEPATRPCYEIVQSDDFGAVINNVNGTDGIHMAAIDGYNWNSSHLAQSWITYRWNNAGVHNFTVGVSEEFSYYEGFDRESFTKCAYFFGSTINGRNFLLDCEEPVKGRYVAVYMDNDNEYEQLQLCDLQVHVLSLLANEEDTFHKTIFGSLCTEDAHCHTSGFQNFVCDDGECMCRAGYSYQRHSHLCIDINECQFEDACGTAKASDQEGIIDVSCKNTQGSFHCACPDGYEFNSGQCIDIDEALEGICGCAHNCINYQLGVDGAKYACTCPPGYQLARNGHSCEDIDECLGLHVQENAIVLPVDGCINDTSIEICQMRCAQSGVCSCILFVKDEDNATSCCLGSTCQYTVLSTDSTSIYRSPPNTYLVPGFHCEGDVLDTSPPILGCEPGSNCLLIDDESDTNHRRSMTSCIPEPAAPSHYLKIYSEKAAGRCFVDFLESGTESGYPPVKCLNTVGSYDCVCSDGYALVNGSCETVDACPGLCEGDCTNTNFNVNGTHYVCDCDHLPGYILDDDDYSCKDVNECLGENNCTYNSHLPQPSRDSDQNSDTHLQGFCTNLIPSYKCDCPDGYEWNSEDLWCEDIDECEDDACGAQNCTNKPGGYQCSCGEGFDLGANGCVDIDECAQDSSLCADSLCINTLGSFDCGCPEGDEWREENSVSGCYDINECNDFPCPDGCENRDLDTDGQRYQCVCNTPGLKLANDGQTCVDIDECVETSYPCAEDNSSPTNSTCENTIGSYECVCEDGYYWNDADSMCSDIDECDQAYGGCQQICRNSVGSYSCDCLPGYNTSENNDYACVDIDECQQEIDGCENMCVNTIGSFDCTCMEIGLKLASNGVNCYWADWCAEANNNMGCEQNCTSYPESPGFRCSCHEGYFLLDDTVSCRDVNECDAETDECEQGCYNTYGTYECSCGDGYKLEDDGVSCEDINECDNRNGYCEDECTNTIGSYTCACREGYELWVDGLSCKDVDECSPGKADCDGICINMPGAYRCACDKDNILGKDGKKCEAPNKVTVQSSLKLKWDVALTNPTSSSSEALKKSLESHVAPLCAKLAAKLKKPILKCEIKNFFPYDEETQGEADSGSVVNERVGAIQLIGQRSRQQYRDEDAVTISIEGLLVGFTLDIVTEDTLSDQDEGTLSSGFTEVLNEGDNKLVSTDEGSLQINSDPKVVKISADGEEEAVDVVAPCDIFASTNYCLNMAVCEVQEGEAVCKCKSGFIGEQCGEIETVTISITEVGLISALAIMGIIMFIIGLGVIWLAKNKAFDQDTGSELEERMSRYPKYPPSLNHPAMLNHAGSWKGAPDNDNMLNNMYLYKS